MRLKTFKQLMAAWGAICVLAMGIAILLGGTTAVIFIVWALGWLAMHCLIKTGPTDRAEENELVLR